MTVAQMSFGFLQFILSTPLPVDRGKLLQDDACNHPEVKKMTVQGFHTHHTTTKCSSSFK